MDYKNSEMKIDQFVGYLNENKINLSPAFQRGHVWKINDRRKLLKNILDKKPIPAVFLYKQATGSKYSYNILDGKQRLESIILYISSARSDFRIQKWQEYFLVAGTQRQQAAFQIDSKNKKTSFQNLPDDVVRDFREYSIPTIEIYLDDEDDSSLTEIISLFIDINQQGVPVNRFNIVKALCLDSDLLATVFRLIAVKQKRGKDPYYKMIDNDLTKVLKRLREVNSVLDPNFKVDRMWERLLEICLYCQTEIHRKPIDIIKGFINKKSFAGIDLSQKTIKTIKKVFNVLATVSRKIELPSPLFTDYTYFYIVATTLTKDGILTPSNSKEMENKLIDLANVLKMPPRKHPKLVKDLSSKTKSHTTDTSNREDREKLLIEILRGKS